MLEVAILNDREHFQLTTDQLSFGIGTDPEHNLVVLNDRSVSNYQCRVEVLRDDPCQQKIKVTNLGGSMVLGNNSRIHHLVSRVLELPCSLGAGETNIQIRGSESNNALDRSIQQLYTPGVSHPDDMVELNCRTDIAPSSETLSSWFESLGQLQRSTASQSDFFKLAARCVFNPGGLDGCIILRKQQDDWNIVAQHIPYPEQGIGYRKDLVEQSVTSKNAIYHDSALLDENLVKSYFHAAVICPVLDAAQNVEAIVYGFRNNRVLNSRKGIRKLEAKYVSLIADAISAGLIRLDHEANRARHRVLLEQAFSPEVARQLEVNPEILNGQEREISVLFADLRGFCRISEAIGATVTYQLLTDVMNRFTQIIHDNHGVVIDYYGDGMSAFWNAPVDQPDHATLAVRAGIAINQEMAALNDVWSIEIGQRLRVGIGIHSGNAQVGNSGSQNRLKYGPQGTTVNIASRLEQTTKKLGVNIVISGETANQMDDDFIAQKICSAKLSGIQNITALFTPVETADYSKLAEYYLSYDKALELFELGEHYEALSVLTEIADPQQTPQPMLSFLLTEINSQLTSNQNSEPQTTKSNDSVFTF